MPFVRSAGTGFLGDCPGFWEDRLGRGSAGNRPLHEEQHYYSHPFGLATGKRAGAMLGQGCPTQLAVYRAGGICAALLGHLAYYYALKLGDVSLVSPVIAAFPVVTVLLAFLLLGEKYTPGKLMGTLLIVLGVFVINK